MAFGRLERTATPKPMSDINMTPLIDVMLVLLVIFIITAPLMASSLRLNLPKAEGAAPNDSTAVLSVAIDPSGQLYLQDQKIAPAQLSVQAQTMAQRNPQTEVQLRADQSVPYGRVAELIGLLQKAGLSRIGFVTSGSPPPAPARP
ncbi:biopolymer transporter ExbD [Ideonella dechloratans]|uniref:Biopolymer transporter ExbD n=1 Tax=Ideonella dechloratans TaxID=36863 RepID=A0A643F990_IDEDE|nr:biopolymer transporter ExbD [Ideonella dechloratans]KAB0578188.1 biopolymer transporter ExbD [Ideonella dechloratans]UFU09842.1 biopolymer transporter ExbD [Ideonella dechloratans]